MASEERFTPRFRVWSQNRKRMYKVTMTEFDGLRFCVTGYPINPHQRTGISGFSDDMVLLRSTGVKDKREKEVYEGDILEYFGAYYLIEWDKERAGFKAICHICGERIDSGTHTQFDLRSVPSMLIKGNVYENPELLKEEK